MKTSVLLLALASFSSCYLIDPPLSLGEPRIGRGHTSYEKGIIHEDGGGQLTDTTFLVSAVAFPESYEWQRDSAFGAVSSKLILYRNGKKALEVPAGPVAHISVSPDKHHIIESSLYTEYSDASGTWIKRNGADLVAWDEPERLAGLLVKDGDVHSVGFSQNATAITYRINGNVALKIAGGVVLGDFGCDCYGPTGALYIDSGQVCFAYKKQSGLNSSLYFVRDCKTESIMSAPGIEILDAKLRNGKSLIFYNESGKSMLAEAGKSSALSHPGCLHWVDGRLTEYCGKTAVIGSFIDVRGVTWNAVGWIGGAKSTGRNQGYVYCDGQSILKIDVFPPSIPDCYFFHRNCACLAGDGLAMVLTPKDTNKPPYMKYGNTTVQFNLHGYLSGIAVEIRD